MDELSTGQLLELRADLTALEAELAAQVRAIDSSAQPVDLDEPIGRLSRMDAIASQHVAAANHRAAQARLRRVTRALASDDYGLCTRCEEPIGFRRLKARPETTLCVQCQSAAERPTPR